jgi:hypothetical protein
VTPTREIDPSLDLLFLLQVAVHERLMTVGKQSPTVEDDDAIVGQLRKNWIVCSARAVSYAGCFQPSAPRRADRPAGNNNGTGGEARQMSTTTPSIAGGTGSCAMRAHAVGSTHCPLLIQES